MNKIDEIDEKERKNELEKWETEKRILSKVEK